MNDLISRKDAIDSPVKMVSEGLEWIPVYHIKELPSAEPEIIRCKDCKHFETDKAYEVDGWPLPIFGHEVCNAWGGGCKTDPDGWCFMGELRGEQE